MEGARVEEPKVEGAEEGVGREGRGEVGKRARNRASSTEGTGTRSLRCTVPLPPSLRVLRLGGPSWSLALARAGGERELVRTPDEVVSGYRAMNANWFCEAQPHQRPVLHRIPARLTSVSPRAACTVPEGRPVSAFPRVLSSDLDFFRLTLERVASSSPSADPSTLSLEKRDRNGRSSSGERKVSWLDPLILSGGGRNLEGLFRGEVAVVEEGSMERSGRERRVGKSRWEELAPSRAVVSREAWEECRGVSRRCKGRRAARKRRPTGQLLPRASHRELLPTPRTLDVPRDPGSLSSAGLRFRYLGLEAMGSQVGPAPCRPQDEIESTEGVGGASVEMRRPRR